MRKSTTLLLKAIPLLFLVLSFVGAKAQENAITYTIANDVQINSKQLEFDLLLLDPDASQNFEEATVQAGIYLNPATYNGGTVTCAIIAGSSTLGSTQVPTSVTFTQAANVIKLASKAPPGCGGGTIISQNPNNRTRICRLRLTNTADWASGSLANLAFIFTTTPYPTKISLYQASDCLNVAAPVSTLNVYSEALNLPLNAASCVAPLPFAVTGGGSFCAGGLGLPIGLAGSELGVNYTLSPGGAVVAGTGAAITFGNQPGGVYSVVGSKICPDLTVLTTPMTGSATIIENPSSTVDFTASACDTYTWGLNGATYTASGDYTYVDGCVTNVLHLTITPSSTVDFTASACDTYTWALNGSTYTTSGNYNYVVGCVTNVLHLTITPSSTVDFTASACDTYTWALNGATYTASGDYTYVDGCVTNVLHLTITPSSTVEFTASACDTYTWALNGATYTASGDYTYVVGCVTNVLHLTITPSSTVDFTASACDTYTWALNGATYTASGDYTYVVGCVTNILHLTITPSGTNEFTASACDSYTWAVNGVTYTASGDYTFVNVCSTNILHLTITPSSTVNFTASACDSYTWALNGMTYTASGDYNYVVGCVTNVLHLTVTPSVAATFAAMGPYVQGSVPGTLPATSIEGFTGSWSPAAISTATVGFATYTFTPDGGQCALAGSLTIEVTAIPCNAAETWNGSVSNDWFNAANWTPAAVPCAITAVSVPAGAANFPTLMAPTNVASIVIASGASFIGSEYLTTGSALVKQDFPVTGYHYISSPVQSTTFNSVFPLAQNAVWAYTYDEATGNWMNQTIANTLVPGTGYSVNMTTPQTAMFGGQLNMNPIALSLSNVNPSGNPSRVGWNLLGNPFSSAISWDNLIKGAGVDGAVYVWNGSAYVSYVGGVGALTGGIIPSVNGFFVKTAVQGDFVIVPLAARVHSNIPFYKESITNLLSLKAEANNYSDETFVNFNESATSGFDGQFDAYKLQNIANAPALYSMITGDVLSINALPMEGNEVVDLGFKCGVNGTYSLNASGIESFDATTPVWLEDLKTGAVQNLRANQSYTFDYTTADNEKRFKLHFKSAFSVPENSLSGINIYSAVRTVVINNTTSLSGEVKIYDLTGRELVHTGMGSQNETRIPVNFAVGTYLVKVTTSNGVASNKVFIR